MKTAGELALRKEGNRLGFSLVIYKVILNVAVILMVFLASVAAMLGSISHMPADPGQMEQTLQQIMNQVTEVFSGWGYLLAVAVGCMLLLLWKKPRFFAGVLKRRGRPMKTGRFFVLLSLFMSGQILYQLAAGVLDWILGHWDISLLQFLEQNSVNTDTVGMFLYVCICAPIFEEIVFRGLMLHSLLPFGRKFAIFMSALFFGLFHGSPLQSAYAVLVGIVLGYVAAEYHILWAMILHMINNLLLADTLPRLLQALPHGLGELILQGVLVLFFLAALVILLVKHRSIAALLSRERLRRWQWQSFFLSPGILVLSGTVVLEMALFVFLLLKS